MAASLADQVLALDTQVQNFQALVQSLRNTGLIHAASGSFCIYGCKVTQGFSATDMILSLDGAYAGDTIRLNPDRNTSPVRPSQYSNFAFIDGEVFLTTDQYVSTAPAGNLPLTVAAAPSTGYHRYDLVYAYVGAYGSAFAIAEGTAVVNASTPTDPTLPGGVLALARVHVQANVTGIANADITDLRTFLSRQSWRYGAVAPYASADAVANRKVQVIVDGETIYLLGTTAA